MAAGPRPAGSPARPADSPSPAGPEGGGGQRRAATRGRPGARFDAREHRRPARGARVRAPGLDAVTLRARSCRDGPSDRPGRPAERPADRVHDRERVCAPRVRHGFGHCPGPSRRADGGIGDRGLRAALVHDFRRAAAIQRGRAVPAGGVGPAPGPAIAGPEAGSRGTAGSRCPAPVVGRHPLRVGGLRVPGWRDGAEERGPHAARAADRGHRRPERLGQEHAAGPSPALP